MCGILLIKSLERDLYCSPIGRITYIVLVQTLNHSINLCRSRALSWW